MQQLNHCNKGDIMILNAAQIFVFITGAKKNNDNACTMKQKIKFTYRLFSSNMPIICP
jgi:hypothetical protein